MPNQANQNPVLNVAEAATYTGVPVRTLNNYRSQKKGPRYLKIGQRVSYRQSELDRWLESCEVSL